MIYGFILCLGDSITNGARDEYNRAYPFELSDLMAERFPKQAWVCINRGVNEWTSADLLRNAYDLGKGYTKAFEVVICIGMNDSKPNIRTPLDIFGKNLEQVLRIMQVLGRHVYLCSIPDFGHFGCINYDLQSESMIKEYNEIIEIQSKQKDVYFVDLSGFDKNCYADSVHLNNTGARTMAERVLMAILRRRGFGLEETIEKGIDG
jgi:lysophospholipase L1-like esterase